MKELINCLGETKMEMKDSGVKWIAISEVLNASSETWVRDRIYSSINNILK